MLTKEEFKRIIIEEIKNKESAIRWLFIPKYTYMKKKGIHLSDYNHLPSALYDMRVILKHYNDEIRDTFGNTYPIEDLKLQVTFENKVDKKDSDFDLAKDETISKKVFVKEAVRFQDSKIIFFLEWFRVRFIGNKYIKEKIKSPSRSSFAYDYSTKEWLELQNKQVLISTLNKICDSNEIFAYKKENLVYVSYVLDSNEAKRMNSFFDLNLVNEDDRIKIKNAFSIDVQSRIPGLAQIQHKFTEENLVITK